MNRRIIITAPSYNPAIGGAIALHRLCDILNRIGYDAYLFPTIKLNGTLSTFCLNDQYNTKVATSIDTKLDIVVYPEIEPGNPLECDNVVRYILNKFHLPEYDNTISTWDEKDYWLYYHELFYDNIRDRNMLCILDSKLDIYKDYGIKRTHESCFTYRKRHRERDILPVIHPSDSIEIGFNVQDEELVNIFNSCKRFYSYDTETYLSTIAALCGCESVIVPNPNISKEDFFMRRESTMLKYGISYGLDKIEEANATRHLLRKQYEEHEIQQFIETKIEFEKIFKYFNS
jgi:hypothetical protein